MQVLLYAGGSLPDQSTALGFVSVHLPGGEGQLVHQTSDEVVKGFQFFREKKNNTLQ